jgi:hypothetical protein
MKNSPINIEVKVFLASILLGVMVWLFDCWVDAYIFSEGTFLDQLVNPTLFEIYIRGLLFIVFAGFGIVVAKIVAKLRLSEEEKIQTIAKLQKAQKEIAVLRKIVPICASCKKIRDNDNAWHQIEGYIRDHSDIEFTHGLCPDCVKQIS